VDARFPVRAEMTTVLSSLFELPEVDLDVDFGELTCDGLRVKLETILGNPNLFGIDIEDLRVVVRNKLGDVLYTCDLDDFAVGPDCKGTLLGDLLIPLDILDEPKLVIGIEGQAGFSGVTMPVSGKIAVKMPDIRNLVAIPETDLDVDFWELTPDGLHMGLQANVTNPNPFGIDVDDLLIVAKTRSGNVILSSSIQGCSIEPNSAGTMSGDLLMPLGVLDRSSVVIKIQTEAGFAEIDLPVSAKMTVKMPDIHDLFSLPQVSLGVVFAELTPDGLPVALQATITNPNPFGIDLGNLQIVAKSQLGEVILTSGTGGCDIEPNLTTTLSVDLLLPLDCLNEPSIVITVQTEAGFAGFALPFSENVVLVNMPDVEGIAGT
jgi:LEA14-like dessication related protein